jgi:hypothetical protein
MTADQKTRRHNMNIKATKNTEDMIPFLQIPVTPSRSIKDKGVKEITVKPVLTNDEIKAREGTYFDEKDIQQIFDEDVDVYGEYEDGTKKLIARFRKNVFDHEVLKDAWRAFYKTAAPSRNRGAAAGPIQQKSDYWKKRKPVEIQGWSAKYVQDGKVSKMRVNNNVFSSVLGFFEATPFMGLPCRLTSYTQKYFKEYTAGIPFLKEIDSCFKTLAPKEHASQLKRAKSNPTFQIDSTAFSSVTVNRNFRTALHKDAGDYTGGFGNLSVLEYGQYTGGYTCFPRFGVAFNIRTGDFIAMDVHEWHCNTEMKETPEQKEYNKKLPKIYGMDVKTGTLGIDKPYTRISFVCYLREKLLDCDPKETKQYYKRVGFEVGKGNLTRKKKRDQAGENNNE